MSAEQLNVQKNEIELKNAVENTEVKKVDILINEIKTAQKSINKKVDMSKENTETKKNYTKEEKEKQETRKNKEKLTAIEIETMKAFIDNSWNVVAAINQNIKDNFDYIGKIEWKPNISKFKEAKAVFENDIKEFTKNTEYNKLINTEPQKTNSDILNTNMKALHEQIEKKETSIQNEEDIMNLETNDEFIKYFSKEQIVALKNSDEFENLSEERKIRITTTLDTRTESINNIETKKLELLLAKTPTDTVAQELFETNESAWNALITKNLTFTDILQKDNFDKLITSYVKGLYPNTTKVEYKREQYNTTKDYFIQAENNEGKKVDIMFGKTSDILYQAQADNIDVDRIRKDGEKIWENITQLDVIWSYREFEDIIDKQTDKVSFLNKVFMEGILDAVDTNPHKGIDVPAKKNWYYGIIIEQITKTKDIWLLDVYLSKIMVGNTINVKYLWTDNANQLVNFAKIQKNWTIDPASDNGKKLQQINAQLLLGMDKATMQETISQWLDKMIDAFGPMLFTIMKLLGFSKGKLTKMFGAERIDKMYKKEYGLSTDQITAVNEIFKNGNFESKPIYPIESWEDLEKWFDGAKTKYINLMADKTKWYYKNININKLKAWLIAFDKDKNINDVVTITTDSTTGKQSIVDIKNSEAFTWAMGKILDDDATRTRIATANASIQNPAVEGKVTTDYNEQGLKIGQESNRYQIDNQADIARYLTASLFSSKDLSFVMTENRLHNDVVLKKPDDNVETKKEELVFIEKYVDKNTWIVSTEGGTKMIHEIIDMNKASKKINITSEKTVTEATLVTLTDGQKTYVESSKASKTDLTIKDRMQFKAWDKITLVEKINITPKIPETNQEKKIKTNREKLEQKMQNIQDWQYMWIDIYTASSTIPDYKDDIINPIKEILETITDVTKTDGKYFSESKELDKVDFLTNREWKAEGKYLTIEKIIMPHIKNMLIMMWWEGKTYENITKNMVEWTTYIAWRKWNTYEINMKDNSWKDIWTLSFWYKENWDKTRYLSPERKGILQSEAGVKTIV